MTAEPNLRIWSEVEKTDPAHTKRVNQRGGFTAISAAYQIMRATEVFGPIGEGWGYDAASPIFQGDLVFVPVTLWHSGDRAKVFGPMFGGAEVRDQKGRVDSDALKKATTDALTKLLSQLGFNADVFLGRFDDNKYVAALRDEFAEENRSPNTPPSEPVLETSMTEGKDWYGCRGEKGMTAHAAKNAGVDKRHDEYRQQITACATTEALRSLIKEITPHVVLMPLPWRIILRGDADDRAEELGANPNERRAA
jgi:hypothetical protein